MTTVTIGPFTLEHDREWRAWRRLEVGDLLDDGDQLHHQSGAWIDVPSHELGSRWMGRDYRRPAPLPSLDPGLVEVLKHTGVFCAGEQQYVRPSRWRPTGGCYWEDLVTREQCLDELRALLPGYEEQLAKERIITTLARPGVAEELARRLEAEEPVDMDEAKPTPVPADGWRPIETAPKDGAQVLGFMPSYYQGNGGQSVVMWHGDGRRSHHERRREGCV
jgi:hypothetical protein